MVRSGAGRTAAALVWSLALLAGCTSGGGDRDARRPRDPWGSAGVARPEISEQVGAEGTVVTVRVRTRLPVSDEANRTGFARRAAKIVWRNHPARVDVLHLTSGDDTSGYASTWRRADLERSFGPRPDGLDTGASPPPPPPPGEGPYRNARATRLHPAAAVVAEVLARTAREHFGLTAQPVAGDDDECFEGFLGDKPTGKFQRDGKLDLDLPGDGEAEARLPGLAAYWAGLGLTVDTEGLDNGLGDLRARIPGLGGLSVLSFGPDQGPKALRLLRFSSVTECFKP